MNVILHLSRSLFSDIMYINVNDGLLVGKREKPAHHSGWTYTKDESRGYKYGISTVAGFLPVCSWLSHYPTQGEKYFCILHCAIFVGLATHLNSLGVHVFMWVGAMSAYMGMVRLWCLEIQFSLRSFLVLAHSRH